MTTEEEIKNKKCSKCGANIEVTELANGDLLIRRDCMCNKEK